MKNANDEKLGVMTALTLLVQEAEGGRKTQRSFPSATDPRYTGNGDSITPQHVTREDRRAYSGWLTLN
jgi:hypothetical protein